MSIAARDSVRRLFVWEPGSKKYLEILKRFLIVDIFLTPTDPVVFLKLNWRKIIYKCRDDRSGHKRQIVLCFSGEEVAPFS